MGAQGAESSGKAYFFLVDTAGGVKNSSEKEAQNIPSYLVSHTPKNNQNKTKNHIGIQNTFADV